MKKWQAALLAAVLTAGLTGCGKGEAEDAVTAFELAHFDGVSEDGRIDSAYFYRNEFTLYGGDAQILYVSEEQSPEYGGYYYLYNSGSDGVILQNVGGEDPHRSVIS